MGDACAYVQFLMTRVLFRRLKSGPKSFLNLTAEKAAKQFENRDGLKERQRPSKGETVLG